MQPTLVRNQCGGVFGDPIVRDKSFFFLDYESLRQILRTITFANIPTA